MPRSDRSLSGAHEALRTTRKVSPHHTATPIRSWSLPVTTLLRWVGLIVVALIAWEFLGPVVRGWLA